MQISEKNLSIFKALFNWQEVPEISQEYIPELAERLGMNISSREIMLKTSWLNYRDYQVMAIDGRSLFHIKRLWEPGSIKEVLGLELARLLDPDLSIPNYVFGILTSHFLHNPIPYLVTAWIPGQPIEKKLWLSHAFELGKQYEFGRWLSIYDCHPRHYFHQLDGSFRRIDYGLTFHLLEKKYEGFADIWPKGLFKNPKFQEGIINERQKLNIRFEILEPQIVGILDQFQNIEIDDFVNVRGYLFRQKLMYYWQMEEILDNCGHLKKKFNFLHSPVVSSTDHL